MGDWLYPDTCFLGSIESPFTPVLRIMSLSVDIPLVHVHPQGLEHLLHDGAGVMTVNEAQWLTFV